MQPGVENKLPEKHLSMSNLVHAHKTNITQQNLRNGVT